MSRTLLRGGIAAALLIAALTPGTASAANGGCQLDGSASFTPGLSTTSQPFTYNFGGTLSSCQSDSGGPASGTVEAGKIVTDPATGEQFQEPTSTGTGGCSSSATKGTAILRWSDGTTTVMDYTTSGAGAAVNLTGTVVPSITIPAINPQLGDPVSMTISTTRYAGATSQSLLAFEADPTQCASGGVSTAGIGGVALLQG